MARKKIENLNFEESLSELETIVNKLEEGELTLEDSMSLFERGLHLSKNSQTKLQDAEQKIKVLVGNQDEEQLQPFNLTENSDQ